MPLWASNFEFLDSICPKRIFMVKKRKSQHHHHWIRHIEISLGTKFQLKLTILILLTRFAQKDFFWFKTEKVNTIHFLHNIAYSNWSSVKFQLKLTNFDLLDQISPKRYFQSQTDKVIIIIEFHIFKLVLVPISA